MAFYFPKDNILFTDGITVPSEKEEFIKRNNNPIIKSYKELSTLINVDDIIEIANRTYLINNDVYTTSYPGLTQSAVYWLSDAYLKQAPVNKQAFQNTVTRLSQIKKPSRYL